MKRIIVLIFALCLLLSACGSAKENAEAAAQEQTTSLELAVEEAHSENTENTQPSESTVQMESGAVIYPLSDTTMENLTDAILSVSLEEGGGYVDDSGIMQMDVKIYSYDRYDMVDIAMLKAGDILVTNAGEVEVVSLAHGENGSVLINGGLYENGFDLVTDDSGLYYECGYNDSRNWYEIGEATIRVSVDFEYHDTSDLELGDVVYFPGSFLIGEVTDYNFTPYNTTIRVENGQIVEMHRVYTP